MYITIAKIVLDELSLRDVKLNLTGGLEGRGWKGDVKEMLLDCSKFKYYDWKPTYNSAQAVSMTTRGIVNKVQKVIEMN